MPLLDLAYFDGPILLEGAADSNLIPAYQKALDTYEADYLTAVLGPSLCAAFEEGLAAVSGYYFSTQFSTQFNQGTIAERWDWIRDGHAFSYGGRTYVWPGLINARKRSPLANYVYWKIIEEQLTAPSKNGYVLVPKMENGTAAAPTRSLVRAWNEMVTWNRVLRLMLRSLVTGSDPLYPEFVEAELCGPESVNVYHPLPLF